MMIITFDGVKKIAGEFGWVYSTNDRFCKLIHGVEFRTQSVIEVAAYIKAELAQRGWYLRSWQAGGNGEYEDFYTFTSRESGPFHYSKSTDEVPFDPEDPLSDAHAILMAAQLVLELEGHYEEVRPS